MIEQTDLNVSEWTYNAPVNFSDSGETIVSTLSLDVMKKRASTKKGIACRFTSSFNHGDDTILVYVAEDSYVVDLDDIVDRNEVLKMVRNSYSKFKETFDFRKLSTILRNKSLTPLDETKIDIDSIVPLLY